MKSKLTNRSMGTLRHRKAAVTRQNRERRQYRDENKITHHRESGSFLSSSAKRGPGKSELRRLGWFVGTIVVVALCVAFLANCPIYQHTDRPVINHNLLG